jgi:hypothetical protein
MEVHIPPDHWDPKYQPFHSGWEATLRRRIAEHPDPAARFGEWLSKKAAGERGISGVKLWLFEQPYLGWAQQIEECVEVEKKALRAEIADEILNPNRDY